MLAKEEMEARLSQINRTLDQLEEQLTPIMASDMDQPPLEQARLQASLAHCMNALFYLYMRMEGKEVSGHPIEQEMDRIKKYLERVEREEGKDPARMRVNAEAVKRFVSRTISRTSPEVEEPAEEEAEAIAE